MSRLVLIGQVATHSARVIIGLLSALGSVSTLAAPCAGFVDVDDSNAEFCAAVTYIASKGITIGCTDTTHFCPNDSVPRLQMALFLHRAGRGDATNELDHYTSTIGGGFSNIAREVGSTIGGGGLNYAVGAYSVIPGGLGNAALGASSFAAGSRAKANYDGCFVWGDNSTLNEVRCDETNQFVVRATHGIFMFTGGTTQASYTGAWLPSGATAWIVASDRASKDNVEAVDAKAVLQKLATVPIAIWNWKSQDPAIRHMGPMAQDFHAAFGLGEMPTGISTVDADGVALAAIQGLYAELKERDATIAAQGGELAKQQREIAELRERVSAAEGLRGELAALKSALAELLRTRTTITAK